MKYEHNSTYLAHHGILGQKWGVRRFQNEDGTLTAAGKERYYDKESSERISKKNDRLLSDTKSELANVQREYKAVHDDYRKWKEKTPEQHYKDKIEKYNKWEKDLEENGLNSEYAQKCKNTYWYQNDASNDKERLELVKKEFAWWKENTLKYGHPSKANEIEESYKYDLASLSSDIKALQRSIKDMKAIQESMNKYKSVPYSKMAEQLDTMPMDDLWYWMYHYHFNDK